MKTLKERILKDGRVLDGNILKVDSFINHQVDYKLMDDIGEEIYSRFADCKVDKILTIETSGIPVAYSVARNFDVPFVFAKKTISGNLAGDLYKTKVFSYTKSCQYDVVVSKKYLLKDENVLVVDDFLANGQAALGMIALVEQAGAKVVGVVALIEKAFQDGGKLVKEKGYRFEALASIEKMDYEGIKIKE